METRKPWTPELAHAAAWEDGDDCDECIHRHSWREWFEYWGAKVSQELHECNAFKDKDCPAVVRSAEEQIDQLDDLTRAELNRRNLNDDLLLPWLTTNTGFDPVEAQGIINAAAFLRNKGDF